MSAAAPASAAQKPVCAICYEDLRPVVEHLQCIPVCGHVFHELCLQQWLEYCPAGKKPTCPVCKQSYALHHPTRLFFQSTGGGGAAHGLVSSQKPSHEADAEALAEDVTRLELKLSSLNASFENQQTHLKKLNEEVVTWKELSKREEARREEIKKEKEYLQQLLNVKMEELSRRTLECTKLQEKSLALAKELAALKLTTDMNLGEEDILKLASLGSRGNPENTVEVLKRSLALRNKSYKELMAQCNLLGRSESRTQQKLSKAKEQIKKLKARLQELEKEFEEKGNQILRDLKSSKKIKGAGTNPSCIKQNQSSFHSNVSFENQTKKPAEAMTESDKTFEDDETHRFDRCVMDLDIENDLTSAAKDSNKVIEVDGRPSITTVENALANAPKNPACVSGFQNKADFFGKADNEKLPLIAQRASSFLIAGSSTFHKDTTSISYNNKDRRVLDSIAERSLTGSMCAKEIPLVNDICRQSPSLTGGHIAHLGEAYDSPDYLRVPCGILGLEGTRNIGKWHRTPIMTSSLEKPAAQNNSGDLIAVGADGRGGRIKVLRSLHQFEEGKTQTALWSQKTGAKGGQSQIDHFFGRT